jgi:hypothetical protein
MVSVLLRTTDLPLFGKRMTTTVHLPGRTAFRLVPTKAQYLLPFVMLIRIVPTDRFGMAIDTEAASFAALTVDPRRITIGRISSTTFGAALTSANITGASVVLVVVDEIEIDVEVVVKVEVVVGATVVGATVVGATVVGGTVVGGTVVGATVVGATVVGATVVGATVVGGTVVGATVEGATVVGGTVVGGTVVVGTTLRVEIAVAVETFDCVPIPS